LQVVKVVIFIFSCLFYIFGPIPIKVHIFQFMNKGLLILPFIFMYTIAFSQDQIKAVDALMRKLYTPDQPGCAIAIVQKNKVVFSKGYGVADLESKAPIDTKTIFNVGSITKQFTSMALLELEAAGKLSLDDKLTKYFPEFSAKQANSITIRNLMTHSSGMIDHYAFVDTRSIRHGVDSNVLQAVEKLDTSYFKPGESYRYSNTAYCLLSLIVAKAGGWPYVDFMQKNIFQPLGMSSSFIIDLNRPMPSVATGYEKTTTGFERSGPDESVFFTTQGDGGLYTSVNDYLKWWMALQNPGFIKNDWSNRARSPQHPIDLGRKLSYGFGWFVSTSGTNPAVYHSGSNGGFRAIVFSIPQEQYAVIIFSNRTGTDLENLVKEINKILSINNKSFIKLDSLISFRPAWPIFAPCKKTPLYLTSSGRSWNASVTELN